LGSRANRGHGRSRRTGLELLVIVGIVMTTYFVAWIDLTAEVGHEVISWNSQVPTKHQPVATLAQAVDRLQESMDDSRWVAVIAEGLVREVRTPCDVSHVN